MSPATYCTMSWRTLGFRFHSTKSVQLVDASMLARVSSTGRKQSDLESSALLTCTLAHFGLLLPLSPLFFGSPVPSLVPLPFCSLLLHEPSFNLGRRWIHQVFCEKMACRGLVQSTLLAASGVPRKPVNVGRLRQTGTKEDQQGARHGGLLLHTADHELRYLHYGQCCRQAGPVLTARCNPAAQHRAVHPGTGGCSFAAQHKRLTGCACPCMVSQRALAVIVREREVCSCTVLQHSVGTKQFGK